MGGRCRNLSTTSIPVISLAAKLKQDGLCSTVGMRPKVNITSSAVNGDPSRNVTASRGLNSQVIGSTGFQDVAGSGSGWKLASNRTSRLNMYSVSTLFGLR